MGRSRVERSYHWFASLLAIDLPERDNGTMEQSLRLLEWDLTAESVQRGAASAGLVAAIVGVGLGVVLVGPDPIVLSIGCLLGIGTGYGAYLIPQALARIERSRALGAAPALVGRIVLGMELTPATEPAVTFATESDDSTLARHLARCCNRTRTEPVSGVEYFGREWGQWFPPLERSLRLVAAAETAPPQRRERTLDRALDTILDGTEEQLAAFVSTIRGPAMGLYAFGVLLPLALIAVLPGATAAGIALSTTMIVLLYNVLLPLGLIGGAVWIVAARPVVFPPPTPTRAHPAVTDRRWPTLIAGIGAGAIAVFAAGQLVGVWAQPVLAIGCGAGTALLVWYRPVITLRNSIRDIESGLPDAACLIGQRVAEGIPVELAIEQVSGEIPGKTGEQFRDVVHRQQRLGVGFEAAVTGRHGVFQSTPSNRIQQLVGFLVSARTMGEPTGEALIEMGDHLGNVAAIERTTRRELASVTDTLQNTAAVFGPLVAGTTISLAERMETTGIEEEIATIDVSVLGTVVGVYVLILSVTLVALASTLAYGFDRATVGYRAGGSMVAASVVFATSYVGAGLVL